MKPLIRLGTVMLSAMCLLMILPEQSSAAAAQPVGEARVYKQLGLRQLRLWIVKPKDWKATDQRPAVVFFHGGGWTGGTATQFNEHCAYLASRGMVCVQVEYRLLDKAGKEPPVWCVQDAKSAMRWVRSKAGELGIDPNRIAAGGGSAGGHLAAFVGMVEGHDDPKDDLNVSPKANALLLFNPVFDNGPDQGWGTARVGNRYKEFSPAHNITADDPTAIVFLGTEDKLIPVAVAERFRDNLEKLGVRCELRLFEGQGHGFFNTGNSGGQYFYETLKASDEFLMSLGWLKGKPTLKKP